MNDRIQYMIDEREKLARMMGFTDFRFGESGDDCLQGWYCRKPDGREVDLPHPWVDANDDYAVLEWVRTDSGIDDEAYALVMLTLIEEQGGDPGHSFPMYRIGNYARAALKVIGETE